MPTFADSELPPPKGWEEFEDIVCSAAKNRWNSPDFTRHGRQGQEQFGVDVYGKDEQGLMMGLQCKNTSGKLSVKLIENEIGNAESFETLLAKLYIATTAHTDQALQRAVMKISEQRAAKGDFEVHILFWNDICQDLNLNADRLYVHYPQLRPQQAMPHDLALYRQFKTELDYEPCMSLLKGHDFGGTFHDDDVQPLFRFVASWRRPDREFNEEALQTQFAELLDRKSVV